MTSTGMFRFLAIKCTAISPATSSGHDIELIRAECNGCRSMICVSEPPFLVNIPAGGVSLTCPKCGARQGISDEQFMEFMSRFPCGGQKDPRAASETNPTGQTLAKAS